ncbi:MAG: hypothetical protein KME54_24010 [Tolypothrix brevis GSE-NOS-MK-07-07A]|nr:hypothetical protein [Tolypothrix brevis GSE-NOS-MK-07-07A]
MKGVVETFRWNVCTKGVVETFRWNVCTKGVVETFRWNVCTKGVVETRNFASLQELGENIYNSLLILLTLNFKTKQLEDVTYGTSSHY